MAIIATKPICPPAAITVGPPSYSVIINVKKVRLGTTQRQLTLHKWQRGIVPTLPVSLHESKIISRELSVPFLSPVQGNQPHLLTWWLSQKALLVFSFLVSLITNVSGLSSQWTSGSAIFALQSISKIELLQNLSAIHCTLCCNEIIYWKSWRKHLTLELNTHI